jgi:small subunit ribosomal protein S20
MANIQSQIKRNQTNELARSRNSAIKSEVRTAIKKVDKAIVAKDVENAAKLFVEAVALIDKSVSAKVTNPSAAARQKSSLQRRLNNLK